MLNVQCLVVGQLATNCFLVFEKGSGECLIIDPGDDFDYIFKAISDLELKPLSILATHGHFDHLLAVNELKAAFQIPFLLPAQDKLLLNWYRKSCQYFTGFDPGPAPKADQHLGAGESVKIGQDSLKVIATPGHSPGGVCFYSKKNHFLISGDTIFGQGGVGRTDFPYSNQAELEKSIEKLLKLPGKTLVYPGHGEKTTIREFKKSWR